MTAGDGPSGGTDGTPVRRTAVRPAEDEAVARVWSRVADKGWGVTLRYALLQRSGAAPRARYVVCLLGAAGVHALRHVV